MTLRLSQPTDLASSLIQSQMMPKFLLAHSTRGVNFIAKDEERHLGEFLDGEECVQFGFRLSKALKVSTVDKEDDSVDFREVVAPETTG